MNFQTINEKIIDDQGNVKTIASGQDARLYYVNFNGDRLKYLLEGEGMTEEVTDTFKLDSFKFYKCSEVLTDITYKFEPVKNGLIIFSTGDTISYNFSYPTSMFINRPIELEPNKDYVIVVENSLIFWSEVAAI